MVNPIKKEEAERLEANRPMVPINLAGLVDLAKLAEQLAAGDRICARIGSIDECIISGIDS